MGIGFSLTGTIRAEFGVTESWFDSVEEWLTEHAAEVLESIRVGEDSEERPTLFISLHPCAEDVEIVVPTPGRVIASGKSSTAGPGYHIYSCNMLHELGRDLGIDWDEPDEAAGTGDDTGYFETGNAQAVEAEFLKWLKTVAGVVLGDLDQGARSMAISMDMSHRYPHEGPLVTPTGPRDLAWLKRVASDPRAGLDLFPWWKPEIDGAFYMGRAICRIWTEVRWRKPLNEEEGDLLMDVHLDLSHAYARDPSLPYPWREWAELMDLVEGYFGYVATDGEDLEPIVRRQAAQEFSTPLIGYRRRPVQVELTGGWSIEVPGEMAEEWDEEGTWTAWDGSRTIWFSSFSLTDEDGSKPSAGEVLETAELPDGDRLEYQGERVMGIAVFTPHEEDGVNVWQLSGRSAVAGALGVCSVFVPDPADRNWALEIWKSLDHA